MNDPLPTAQSPTAQPSTAQPNDGQRSNPPPAPVAAGVGGPIRRVVIPAAAGVGNAILFTPTLRQLHRALGGPRVVVLAIGNAIADVFRDMPEVAEVKLTGGGAKGFRRFVRFARDERADLYLVPFPSNRWQYNVLARTSGARLRVMHGYPNGRWRGLHDLSGAVIVPGVPRLHDTVQNLRLLPAIGVTPDYADATPVFPLSPDSLAAGQALAEAFGVGDGRRFVVMHGGSGATVFGEQKRWPPAKFAEVARRIVAELDHDVIVVEGPDERGMGRAVAELAADPRVRPGPLAGRLGASAALLKRAAFYVGNDSAVAHIAAAVGTRAVTVFAPTDPSTCLPVGSDDLVVQLVKRCAPCFTYPFETPYPSVACRQRPYCIEEVQVDVVMAAVCRAGGRGSDE